MPTYYAHDNGGRPFKVSIDEKKVEVYKKGPGDDEEDTIYSKLIKSFTAKEIHIGKSSGKTKCCDHTARQANQFNGNSILLHTSDKEYVYIGHEIIKFQILDEFVAYYSPVGNNDVPYPLVLGDTYVYFILDHLYVKRDLFPAKQVWECAYTLYYGTFDPQRGWDSPIQKTGKRFRGLKTIEKRLY